MATSRFSGAYKVNKCVSWAQNKKCLVVYCYFNFYFFKGRSRRFVEKLLGLRENDQKSLPNDFIDYLYEKRILV